MTTKGIYGFMNYEFILYYSLMLQNYNIDRHWTPRGDKNGAQLLGTLSCYIRTEQNETVLLQGTFKDYLVQLPAHNQKLKHINEDIIQI